MEISLLTNTFSVRKAEKTDIALIYDLCRKNDLFYQYHQPLVTRESILEDMETLPPGKAKEDKYYLGFFEGEALVAVMDLILAYPTKETAYIGFFMVDAGYQNQGIGSGLINETLTYLKEMGYEKVRLGVDRGNPQSYAFWLKNGFAVIREEKYILMESIL